MILAYIIQLFFFLLFPEIRKTHFTIFLITQICLMGIVLYVGYLLIWRQIQLINRLFTLFVEGYSNDSIFLEELAIAPVVDKAVIKIQEMLDKQQRFNMSKKQAEFLALQNQINPHFLYNTLEGIRSEALCSGMDGVAEMTEALATFFRYTISNVDNLVTLEDELSNIENYYIIQQYRFGDRLSMEITYDDGDLDVLNLRLPKLTLQPIVENSIYHGIERKIDKGKLEIKIQTTNSRLIIIVSDDGLGIGREMLDELNAKLITASIDDIDSKRDKRGGIAIINVNNRIKLLFGDEFGIHIYSKLGVGTDVVVTLPLNKE